MKLVQAERNGESFDSQLVIGVRDSYGKKNIYVEEFFLNVYSWIF